MTNSNRYYVKSFEIDFSLKTLQGDKKVPSQSIQNIIQTNTIHPNTKSFGQERRLSTTIIHKNYLKTYRSQGLIFQTRDEPEYALPFDLGILADTKDIIVQYYKIKDNLHIYYNHKLIPGFEKFIFKTFEDLVEVFPTPQLTWEEANMFRKNHGHKELSKSKYKLVEYNEIVFIKPVHIKPIAIYGYKKEAKDMAKELGLPHYKTTKEFFEKVVV
jgi:hypothetical protein